MSTAKEMDAPEPDGAAEPPAAGDWPGAPLGGVAGRAVPWGEPSAGACEDLVLRGAATGASGSGLGRVWTRAVRAEAAAGECASGTCAVTEVAGTGGGACRRAVGRAGADAGAGASWRDGPAAAGTCEALRGGALEAGAMDRSGAVAAGGVRVGSTGVAAGGVTDLTTDAAGAVPDFTAGAAGAVTGALTFGVLGAGLTFGAGGTAGAVVGGVGTAPVVCVTVVVAVEPAPVTVLPRSAFAADGRSQAKQSSEGTSSSRASLCGVCAGCWRGLVSICSCSALKASTT
jgi:hypothetical protein